MTITNEMQRAIELIETTDDPIYITGKAGTGKTTLLKYIISTIRKQFVVTAPTGVAAINAGGVTLHSLLNIPFGCLDEKTAIGKLPPKKVKLINSIDAIIIDEVSMVRPDLLDFVDRKLRTYRVDDRPFGGLQLIMFGDLYQLPPVVKADERKILQELYKGDYFFYAHVLKETGFNVVELSTIFRQTDQRFIRILNNIRSYNLPVEDMEELAERKDTAEAGQYDNGSIHICTHRNDVQKINTEMLGSYTHTFVAEIKDKFNPNNAPCEIELKIREGARVMLLTNNSEAGYHNGSLGNVTGIEDTKIKVKLDNDLEVVVERHTWEAVEYEMEGKKVVSKTVGSCTQFPLALAWAITIHKSQGLTFDQVTVHCKRAFCAGQVYVALSRCTSLEGVVLDSFVTKRHIMPDSDLVRFEKALQQTEGEFTEETYNLLNS